MRRTPGRVARDGPVSRGRAGTALGLVALAAGAHLACGASCAAPEGIDADAGSGGGSACVSATACPDAGVPSYQTDIVPILEQECISCHGGPGSTAGFPMSTYKQVYGEFGSILSQVTVCQMPPSNGPTMTATQRVTLTAWLRCGAPDN